MILHRVKLHLWKILCLRELPHRPLFFAREDMQNEHSPRDSVAEPTNKFGVVSAIDHGMHIDGIVFVLRAGSIVLYM